MKPIVSVTGLSRVFDVSKPWLNRVIERLPKAMLTAVSDVSFEIEENTVYALVGESGSGKSTVARCIVRLNDAMAAILGLDFAVAAAFIGLLIPQVKGKPEILQEVAVVPQKPKEGPVVCIVGDGNAAHVLIPL